MEWSHIKKYLSDIYYICPWYIPNALMSAIIEAMEPIISLFLIRSIIDDLVNNVDTRSIIGSILFFVGLQLGLKIMNRSLLAIAGIQEKKIKEHMELLVGQHIMEIDYEAIENPEILKLREEALIPLKFHGVINRTGQEIKKVLRASITIALMVGILLQLDPLFIVCILVVRFMNKYLYKMLEKKRLNYYKELAPLNRKFMYYKKLGDDFSIAKDIRIFEMENYLIGKFDGYYDESFKGAKKLFTAVGLFRTLININIQIQTVFFYGYMSYKYLKDLISIGSFLMYVTASIQLANNVYALNTARIEMKQMLKYMDKYYEFMEITSKIQWGHKKRLDGDIAIEFKNVYFRYPNTDNYVLKGVSGSIKPGQNVSIVGKNGAGKSTFIKLLARLYEPTKGEILINGVHIKDFSKEEYYKMLGVVFQDFKLLAFSIEENIHCGHIKEDGEDLIRESLAKANLHEKINKLQKGVQSNLYKLFDDEGIRLSGGQEQKLVIARALYKQAPILILDEPTASLDPYAEEEIYLKLNSLAKEQTAIFISHRLSSCKFTDQIFVFDKGKIVEQGNHHDLYAAKSLYHQMFESQARYYDNKKEEVC